MFASAPERKMRSVQAILFAGWLLLIASLFWDPITPHLTHPDNLTSPFRIKGPSITVQGEELPNEPYSLSARIWWAMVVPILPLFLMVFGHEAWRRICPLSFASQIPRRLGFNRKRPVLQRRTGKIEHTVVVFKRSSWLQRNAWYLQGGLLFAGLSARLVFVNSDRIALGIFLLAIITSSIVVGYLFGGKTWCNFFCPVNVVQKIYTEPRGILESAPHLTRAPIPQSMCRTPTNSGDTSACVACTSDCGDIDLERSYWDSINNHPRRHVHYMFWGLIVGFYGYYYLYSGSWDYYFSGMWTHEAGALGKVFSPGFYINGVRYGVPKIIAAPLTLAISCAASLFLGLTLERLYRRTRTATKRIAEEEILHHCLAFSAYLSINTFYLFGGRPNLLLLPPTATRCIDILIVSLTTWWFLQAIHRTPFRYRRESMASSLLGQLKRLRVDVTKYLDGRTLDELKPDEVYVLTKVLPAFSHEQKQAAYRQILDDAIATGKTKSSVSLGLLHEMRVQLNISDEDHHQIIETLRAQTPSGRDGVAASSHEKWDCLRNYTEILGAALVKHVEEGRSLDEALGDAEVHATSAILRASFQISEVEHAAVVANIVSANGILMDRMNIHLESLKDMLSARFCMQSYGMADPKSEAIGALLTSSIDRRIERSNLKLLSLLRTVGDSTEARWNARNISMLSGESLRQLLGKPMAPDAEVRWDQAIDEHLMRILHGDDSTAELHQLPTPDGLKAYSFRDVISSGVDLVGNLHRLADDDDAIVLALVLAALHDVDAGAARSLAENIRNQSTVAAHPLLDEILGKSLGEPREIDDSHVTEPVEMMTRMLWLSRCAELSRLPLSALATLAANTQVRQYSRNEMLCLAGQPVEQVFIVRSGVVLRESTHGDEAEPIDPGCNELIGSFDSDARHDGVRVVSPSAQVLAVNVDAHTIPLVGRRVLAHAAEAIANP